MYVFVFIVLYSSLASCRLQTLAINASFRDIMSYQSDGWSTDIKWRRMESQISTFYIKNLCILCATLADPDQLSPIGQAWHRGAWSYRFMFSTASSTLASISTASMTSRLTDVTRWVAFEKIWRGRETLNQVSRYFRLRQVVSMWKSMTSRIRLRRLLTPPCPWPSRWSATCSRAPGWWSASRSSPCPGWGWRRPRRLWPTPTCPSLSVCLSTVTRRCRPMFWTFYASSSILSYQLQVHWY